MTKNSRLAHCSKSACGHSFVDKRRGDVRRAPYPFARIDVGHVIGKEPWEHTVWVEREFLETERHETGA